ncbi:hypothetical protein Aab01nite_45280 [Paractinoplanes abujensis]|nr:hypothetical protein Aab01nite_45280 [Actinoplanes abujensis]
MNSSDPPPDPVPLSWWNPQPKNRRVSLRHFVVVVVAVAVGMFAWYRTGGDWLLSVVVGTLTAAAIDDRVGDAHVGIPPDIRR